MQAVKVFNNNAVSVVMPDGREAILVGNRLGFGCRPGDVIDKSRVSKVYYVQNELQTKFLKMLDNVTPQVMQAAERISLAAEEQGILLSRNEVCLQRINAYLRQEFDYELDHQEQVYLLIHLTKIVG
ncbi:MAG: CAT RNA binding domain-containing protein [Faecalibacterium sp.]|nr:CAT RNA binding domain-containing protein [Faecalibacterium sp.]